MDKNKARVFHTKLYGQRAHDILSALHGAMSDGIWENSPSYNKYWLNFNVMTEPDGETVIYVSTEYYKYWCHRHVSNPFINMSETDFFAWLAGKLKTAIGIEAKDYKWQKGWWKRVNTTITSCYLNYKLDITVADIYCVYDSLLGRMNRSLDETNERIFGTAKSAEETEAEVKRRETKAKINAAYEKRGEEIRNWKAEAIKKIEAVYSAKTTANYEQWRAELREANLPDHW